MHIQLLTQRSMPFLTRLLAVLAHIVLFSAVVAACAIMAIMNLPIFIAEIKNNTVTLAKHLGIDRS